MHRSSSPAGRVRSPKPHPARAARVTLGVASGATYVGLTASIGLAVQAETKDESVSDPMPSSLALVDLQFSGSATPVPAAGRTVSTNAPTRPSETRPSETRPQATEPSSPQPASSVVPASDPPTSDQPSTPRTSGPTTTMSPATTSSETSTATSQNSGTNSTSTTQQTTTTTSAAS